MTKRFHTIAVVLEVDMREDDAQPLMSAINQMRGVLSVSGIESGFDANMAEQRAKQLLLKRVIDTINGKL
jgi:hypothetical protein